MKRRLETLWARAGKIQVSDLANSFFLVRFSEAEDYNRAVTGGPWKIYDYYISVARWSPSFNENEPIKKIMTWVRLPKLPIQYFNNIVVTRIGNYIGKTIRLDLATSEGARGRYARVCVEIDLSKPLLGKYMLEDRVYLVEYESIENFCFGCGKYGSKAVTCPSCNPVDLNSDPEKQLNMDSEQPKDGRDTGSWMTVGRRVKKPPVKQTQPSKEPGSSGSQFDILLQEEARVEDSVQQSNVKAPDAGAAPADLNSSQAHAEALARVLEEAFQPEVVVKALAPMTSKAREALGDVTNLQGKPAKGRKSAKQNKEVVTQSQNQIQTPPPVMHQNPIFQADPNSTSAPSGNFARIRSRLYKISNSNVKPPAKTLSRVKKFKAKGGQPLANGMPPEVGKTGETSGNQPNPGEPIGPIECDCLSSHFFHHDYYILEL
ncbi:hypothetical protein LINPERHAP2_LOCUS33936 [Linum perenne]